MPDDDLQDLFADVGAWTELHTVLPGPARARRSAGRRSAAVVASAAALTVLAVVGSVVGVSRFDTASAPAAPVVGSPVPVAPERGEPGRPEGPPPIPEDMQIGPPLLNDGETETSDLPGLPADVEICRGGGLPGIDTAVDQRFRRQIGPESAHVDGLLVFADPDDAVSFMSGLREAADRCADGDPAAGDGSDAVRLDTLPGAWGDGVALLLLSVPEAADYDQPIIGSYLLVVRVGTAVALRFAGGEYLFDELPAGPSASVVAVERRPLDALAPQLCRWTAAGC